MLPSQGNLEDAQAEAAGAAATASELGYPGRIVFPLSVLVETALRRGETADARSALASYGQKVHGMRADRNYAQALAADADGDRPALLRRPCRFGVSSTLASWVSRTFSITG